MSRNKMDAFKLAVVYKALSGLAVGTWQMTASLAYYLIITNTTTGH